MKNKYYLEDKYKADIIRTAEKEYLVESADNRGCPDKVFTAVISSNWGFFLVESLSTLWGIAGSGAELVCKSDVPVSRKFGTHTWRILEILSLLGIDEKDITVIPPEDNLPAKGREASFFHIEVPTYGKKTPLEYVKLLDSMADGKPAYCFTDKYAGIYKRLRDNCVCDLPKYDRIYFSRTRLKQKKEIGEKALEKVFIANGFTILYPEQLSPMEQIWYVKNCRVLASVEGTLAHNSLFSSPGMKQIILRKQSEIIPRQFMINKAMDIDTVWIDCYSEPFSIFPLSHSKGPFFLKANDNLRRFCDENGYVFCKPSFVYNVYCTARYVSRCLKAYGEYFIKNIVKKKK